MLADLVVRARSVRKFKQAELVQVETLRRLVVDAGIALQSLVLGAAQAGLATCILGTVDRAKLQPALDLPARFRILYVLALGKPAESVVVEAVGPDGDVRYWRDVDGLFHVPKRTLDDLIVEV
jgi:nitroreductase